MQGQWPLVGRAAELARVDALLRGGGRGVVLAGPPGVGKTRLAAECLNLAGEHGFSTVRVAATQAASGLPFGAFAALLPEGARGADRTAVLRQIADAVLARGGGDRVALLVDDAHLLDEASAALTHHLAASDRAFVCATLRAGEPASDAVVGLWKDGRAERVEVPPLTRDEVQQLLQSVLGGPLEGAAGHRLFELSEGNVLYLRELVLATLDGGALRLDGGIWCLRGPLPGSARLVELVEARLVGLAAADRRCLEALALGEPLGVDLLAALEPDAELGDLERRGLVRVEPDGRRLQVRFGHPLYADVLRARLSPLRSRALSTALADAVGTHGARRREDVLRLAKWRLESGGTSDPAVMLAGAREARALHEMELGERLARASLQAAGGVEAELQLAELLLLQGRYDDTETVLSAVLASLEGAARPAVALMRIDSLAFGGRAEEALVALLEAEAEFQEARWLDELAVRRAMFALVGGYTSVAAELVQPLLSRVTGQSLVTACIVAALAFGLGGRITDGLAATEQGLAAHEALGTAHLIWDPAMTTMIRARNLAWGGYLAESEAVSQRGYDSTLAEARVEPRGWFAGSMGQVKVMQGQLASAIRWGHESMSLLRPLGRRIYFRVAAGPPLQALAMAGEADEADALLAEAEAATVPMMQWEAGEIGRARAWIAVARGDMHEAVRQLEQAAATAASSGDRVIESAALHDLARLGRARQVASRLAELAELVEGPLAAARADHAGALAGRDPAGLEMASAAFEDFGALLLAAEAAADAAVAWRKAGRPRPATAADRRAQDLMARCEGARTPALTAVGARATLSARELEIARLAAAGVANKEIAARLFLSLHTVQNKLHAAYEKLGIKGRSDLPEALDRY